MRRSPTTLVLAALASFALAAGCGGGGGSSGPKEASLAGSWQWTSGPLVSSVPFGALRYLQLDPSGSGTIIAATPTMAIPYCLPLIYATLSGGRVTFEIPAVVMSESGTVPLAYHYQRSGNTLTLIDPVGQKTVFAKVASVPASAACNVLNPATPIPMPSAFPVYFSRTPLMGDASGNLSWGYGTAPGDNYPNGIVTFSPATHGTSNVIAINNFTQYDTPVTSQAAGDYWFESNAGHNNDLERRLASSSTVNDDVSTVLLGRELDLTGSEWDGTNLWLSGYDYLQAVPGFVQEVDSTSEPDLLLAQYPLDFYPEGLATKGSDVYLLGAFLQSPFVVKLNGATGAVEQSWSLPNPAGDYLPYFSLANAGGTLYTMSSTPDGQSTFVVALPGI